MKNKFLPGHLSLANEYATIEHDNTEPIIDIAATIAELKKYRVKFT